MSYRDYISTKQSGGFLEGTIFDSTNPFWYNAYQYVPRDYVGLDVDNHIRLILERNKKKTPEMPDLSKFREKLDKDLLYGEKSILIDRFNTLERAIREELQYNPYALSNNPTIIGYFNELVNMYNSAELQSQIDKKNEIVKQIAEARESGQQESYVKDAQTKEYIPATMGQMAEAFMNSEGKNRYLSTVFGDLTPKGYRNTTFSNVGKGTEKDFTEKMNEVYRQVREDSIKEGGTSSGITYIDAFGQTTNPAYAEGYIKTVSGSYEKNATNIAKLAETTKFFKEQQGEFNALLGEKAQEGFNQLVAKTLNGSSFTNQLANVLELLKKAKQEAEAIAKKNNTQLGETTFDIALIKATKLLEDKDLEKALSQVSSQQLLYDLSVIRSDKNENVKALVIKSNPVLSLLLSKENGMENLQILEQLLNLVKITTQESIINKNTNFNTIINKQVHREKMTESDVFLFGEGYGGDIKEQQKQEFLTDYVLAINSVVRDEDLKERQGGLSEAISKLKILFPKAKDEDLKNLLLKEAAANDYLTNLAETKDVSKTGMEEIVRGLLQGKSRDEIVNNALNAHASKYGYRLATEEEMKELAKKLRPEEYKDYVVDGKVYVKKVDKQLVPLQGNKVRKAKEVVSNNIEIARREIDLRVKKYEENPEGFAINFKQANIIPTTKGDERPSVQYTNMKRTDYFGGEALKNKVITINGIQVPEEALPYIQVQNGADNAEVTQFSLLTLGKKVNVPVANHRIIINKDELSSATKDMAENTALKKFYNEIEKQEKNGKLVKGEKGLLGTAGIPISKDQRTLSPNDLNFGTGVNRKLRYKEDFLTNEYNDIYKKMRDIEKVRRTLEDLVRLK